MVVAEDMIAQESSNQASLKASWRVLILISANLARGGYQAVAELLEKAGTRRIPTIQIYEIMLQSYLFLGYPRAIEGLRLLQRHFPRFKPPGAEGIDAESTRRWQERGESLCRQTYDSNYERLRERMRILSPDLDQWMVWEGYGKVLSRPGAPSALRELCTCAALVVTGDMVQLHSHYRGALNAGASLRMLREMTMLIDRIAEPARHRQASMLLEDISRKAGERA